MSKDIAKIKEDVKNDLVKLRDDLKQEMKLSRESFERDLRNEMREIRNEQRSVAQSLEFAHKTIEDLKSQLAAAVAKNTELTNSNKELQAKCQTLENHTGYLEKRLVHLEQYSRNSNIEIQGVRKEENENVLSVLSKIGEAINEPVQKSDIEVCHRVPTRNPDRSNIIVQFKSRAKRDLMLKKAKKMRIRNNDIGLSDDAQIYVNEHLCPALKRLLGMAVKRKHEKHWKSVWSFNGKIFARKSDDSGTIQIAREVDLEKII
ncbi:uncharacterized protein LOC125942767 [Dermacentor silvarum]|uniref:uncharacterized protein LOC125942767 n=1 Tax=Dermacentor silvarum TaxID=543639 RepID=UPI00210140D3|nr:uncharacterized protein LOC125942767 [Dermacentor silvarum]